jgi:predicted molibdopterin-dependent oxidoreductase YjgC
VRYANSLGAGLMGMAAAYKGGKTAQAMLSAAGGEIKALVIAGEDVVAKGAAAAKLSSLDFLVVSEMFMTETAKLADVVFPATSFAESQGTQINNGMQIQFVRRAIPPVGQARPDWMILGQVAKLMGADFGFQGQLKNVFKEMAEKVPGLAGLSHNLLANEGATQIRLPRPDRGKVYASDMKDRLNAEVARVNKGLAVDRSEMAAQAGARLKTRYPLITRYSEMISPELLPTEAGKAVPMIFPA